MHTKMLRSDIMATSSGLRKPWQAFNVSHATMLEPQCNGTVLKMLALLAGTPWMRVHDDYPNVNVADQEKDANSPLSFYKKMIQMRHKYSDLAAFGDFDVWDQHDLDVFTFTKSTDRRWIFEEEAVGIPELFE